MGSYLFSSMLNHSCDPNVKRLFVSNKNVLYVCKPIKKGSEIFKSYSEFSTSTKAERKPILEWKLERSCTCTACKKDWPTIDRLPAVDSSFKCDSQKSFASHKQSKKTIARNNAYVDKNYKENNPTREVYITIHNNLLELYRVARPSFAM